MTETSSIIFDDVVKNFSLSAPAIDKSVSITKNNLIAEYEQLCSEKYSLYERYYAFDNTRLLEEMAVLGGKFGGVTRRMRTACIVSLLKSLQANNSKGFERFSVTCFKELSKYLFNVAPSREHLLKLAHSGYGRITTNGLNVDYAIAFLCSKDDDSVRAIKAYYDDYMKSFKSDIDSIKSVTDAKIMRLKESSNA